MINLKSIDVVILCGGLGKRLRPEVGRRQKTMALIQGQPFLDFLLTYLRRQGFRRVILCTGFQAGQVRDYYRKKSTGLEILFSPEKTPLGTGGAIRNARALIKSDPFVALNGDCFCRLNYRKFVEFFSSRHARAALVLSASRDRKDFGTVVTDARGRITGFMEKAAQDPAGPVKAAYTSNGIYCFGRDILNVMPRKKSFSIERDFFPKLPGLLKQRFLGFVWSRPFIDIGTPERFRKAQKWIT